MIKNKKMIVGVTVVALIAAFFLFDLKQYFDLSFVKSQLDALRAYYTENSTLALLMFFVVYVAVTALSLPGAALMTLLAGALFGLSTGLILVSFASTIGATLAFLLSRYLFREAVESRFGSALQKVNTGIEREGGYYLLTLRLVPLFPFFVINLVMGLTKLKVARFYWVSQLGMLPGTYVYVNVGTQLGQLDRLDGILTPAVMTSLVLLAIFPWIAKRIVDTLQAKRVYKGYKKPKHFDRNAIVIGAGSAGLVSAYIGAALKAKVTLIERHKMGGDCLNTGCVPSKTLLRSAKLVHDIERAESLGLKALVPRFHIGDIMDRVSRVIKTIEPHDSVERYTDLGVECVEGEAKLVSPWSVSVNGKLLTARTIIIASGARPAVPNIIGLETVSYLTSDTLWKMTDLPNKMVVMGGGAIGCEMSQAFARLGCEVTQVELAPRILNREDPEVSEVMRKRLESEGVKVLTGHEVISVEKYVSKTMVVCKDTHNKTVSIPCDELLIAVGRQANVEGLGLEELGIRKTSRGTLEVNEYLQTKYPNIYACGDVVGPYQLTHAAAHQAWYCVVNGFFGALKKFRVDYSAMPWAIFTDPEVARVGLSEGEAKDAGVEYEVTRYGIDDLDRAIAEEVAEGFVKVLTRKGTDKIVGVTIVGPHAGDIISEFVLAMKNGIGLNKILSCTHIYPTFSEANRFAAGAWKREHQPKKIMQWLERFQQWRLG